MANQEHLDILKQGVFHWNQWRKNHPKISPDLSGADLIGADLGEKHGWPPPVHTDDNDYMPGDEQIKLFFDADPRDSDDGSALIIGYNLRDANLSGADLSRANLSGANLRRANLIHANLIYANLTYANLTYANLTVANLGRSNLSRANLSGANLTGASIEWALFGDVDLSVVKGLETVKHGGPSTIGIDTIIRSQGKIPEIFLRNAGVPASIIEAIPSLVGSLKPIDFYSCFISYSSKDQDFAERLYADLQAKGVRCWFAPHDIKIGDPYRHRIEESIRLYDKLLLILSKHAVISSWVEQEVETALEKERHLREQGNQRTVLFPVKLDDTVMQTTTAWAANVRRLWHIGDFCRWKDHDQYQKAFSSLLRDLKAEA